MKSPPTASKLYIIAEFFSIEKKEKLLKREIKER